MQQEQPVAHRVLVVEDDALFGEVICHQLQRGGYPFRLIDSHEEAINLLRIDGELDVVLLDHGTTGGEVGRFVSTARCIRPDLMIVGSSASDCREEFEDAGVHLFLLKPWTLDDLINVLAAGQEWELRCGDTRIGLDGPDTRLLRLYRGQTVQVAVGPMEGCKGVVVGQRAGGRVLLELEGGILLEIDQCSVESASR